MFCIFLSVLMTMLNIDNDVNRNSPTSRSKGGRSGNWDFGILVIGGS